MSLAEDIASDGCSAVVEGKKCGETAGLEIFIDFNDLYESKLQEIISSGDNVMGRLALQEQWIKDLIEQNMMLCEVVKTLETTAINKLKNLNEQLEKAKKCPDPLRSEETKTSQEQVEKTLKFDETKSDIPTASTSPRDDVISISSDKKSDPLTLQTEDLEDVNTDEYPESPQLDDYYDSYIVEETADDEHKVEKNYTKDENVHLIQHLELDQDTPFCHLRGCPFTRQSKSEPQSRKCSRGVGDICLCMQDKGERANVATQKNEEGLEVCSLCGCEYFLDNVTCGYHFENPYNEGSSGNTSREDGTSSPHARDSQGQDAPETGNDENTAKDFSEEEDDDSKKAGSENANEKADLKKTIKNLTETIIEIQDSLDRFDNKKGNRITKSVDLLEKKAPLEKIKELENKIKLREVEMILTRRELQTVKENYAGTINSIKQKLSTVETNQNAKQSPEIQFYLNVVKEIRESVTQMELKIYNNNSMDQGVLNHCELLIYQPESDKIIKEQKVEIEKLRHELYIEKCRSVEYKKTVEQFEMSLIVRNKLMDDNERFQTELSKLQMKLTYLIEARDSLEKQLALEKTISGCTISENERLELERQKLINKVKRLETVNSELRMQLLSKKQESNSKRAEHKDNEDAEYSVAQLPDAQESGKEVTKLFRNLSYNTESNTDTNVEELEAECILEDL